MTVVISDRELYIMDDGTHHPLSVFYLHKCGGKVKQRAFKLFWRLGHEYVYTGIIPKTINMHSGYVDYATMEDLLYIFENWKMTGWDFHSPNIKSVVFDVIAKCYTPHKHVREMIKEAWKIHEMRENIKMRT